MSFYASSWRLVRFSAPRSTTSSSPLAILSSTGCTQRRTISLPWFKKKEATPKIGAVDHLTEGYLKKKPSNQGLQLGTLSESSIFEDEEIVGEGSTKRKVTRDQQNMAAAIDPDPENRRRWERKMVIRDIRKRGRLTRKQELKQKEREILSKSHYMKTSTKKLMFLARQIAGKPVDEAILQMRFSVKKAAKEVKYHLEHARNEAIVKKGMGLGQVHGTAGSPIRIQTKDGKRLKIEDRTRLYVDQAWVGKGNYDKTPDHRARGRVNMMKNPTAAISVVLKEENTRIRLHEEREEKAKKAKVWTHLPNRPITSQRQYYSW